MILALTEAQIVVRELFAGLFAKEATPERVRSAEPLGFDLALWEHVIATGALGVAVAEEAGGAGAGVLEMALIAEEVGRRLAPVPFVETAAAARLLARCGATEMLGDALEGRQIVSLARAPIAEGSASQEGQLLADGAVADIIVGLRGDEIVAMRRPPEVRPVTNLGSLPMARWGHGEVDVLADGDGGRAWFAAALDELRVLRAAALIGLTEEAIEIGAAYARERRAFSVPIGTYQAVAHPLADALVAKDGGELLVWKASWALDSDQADGPALAAMAFVFAAETAYRAAQHSLHIHGGYGFTAEYDIQLYYRRAQAWTTVFADPRRELQVVADRTFGPPSTPQGQG